MKNLSTEKLINKQIEELDTKFNIYNSIIENNENILGVLYDMESTYSEQKNKDKMEVVDYLLEYIGNINSHLNNMTSCIHAELFHLNKKVHSK